MNLSVEDIRSLTDFYRNSESYIELLLQSKRPMVLTLDGEPAVVVQDARVFQAIQDKVTQLEQELEKLKREALKHDIQLGVEQVEAGQFSTYTEETASDLVEQIRTKARKQLSKA